MNTDNDSHSFLPQRNGDLPPSLSQTQSHLSSEGEEDNLDIGWLFGVVRRRIPIMAIVAVVLTGVFGGLIFTRNREVPPLYKGKFRLLIEPISAEGRLMRQFLLAQASGTDLSKIRIEESGLVDYETQIRVLKSPKLLMPILENLEAEYPKLSYKSLQKNLKVDRISVDISGKEFGTKILEVTYADPDPDKILTVLEEASELYLEYSLEERLTSLTQGIDFIEEQLPVLQDRVDTIQTQIQNLRQQENLIEPYPQAQAMTQEASSLNLQQLDNQKELVQARALYEGLQQQLAIGNATAVLSEDPQFQPWIAEAQELESKVAAESARLQPDSLPMLALREQQAAMDALLQQEAQAVLATIEDRITAIEASARTIGQAEANLDARVQRWPVATRQYADLQQELEIVTSTLTDFLTKREALGIDAAQQQIPWVLIAPPAIPENAQGNFVPSEVQQTKRQIAIAAILSTLLGIGAGFLVEVLQTVFHQPSEIKSASRLPLLAAIPRTRNLKRTLRKLSQQTPEAVAVASSPSSAPRPFWGLGSSSSVYRSNPFSEAFRSLYANIRLLGSESSLQSLTVSSAMPADGKSTVALHLAQTSAAAGLRVLLVDADLRAPSIHQQLDLPNLKGFSNVLTSDDVSLNEAIVQSKIDDNLFVLPAGPIPPDSVKLLASNRMQYVVEQFKSFFDLVIYDTPPLHGLADGNLVGAKTDGVVMVVAIEKTDRNLLAGALEGLKLSGASILGVVANGVKK
ncbi:polysaccharide biosynthesis tyrosine autokinase [Oscillatoriales cyanobacterium LEGE 11467]|uniref:non-specific protein-tyrosine kinase n=1 Tax=Zarconia navalis LEGE 11467 TaxID=1828826 RepID=A0A928Z9G1_9CYAN|nr:polysaccharide biosynthesis tyrosine autokinase [Zarconia navalis]MBE9041664.1 polysaccharide biosynthesis tyrosine autokinase [Zarconia navalis LEGE 11467]